MMPLQQQLLQVDLGLGLDTKTDPKKVAPGRLTTAENVRFRKNGQISKRYGYNAVGSDTNKIEKLIRHDNQVVAKVSGSPKLKRYVSGSSGTQWIDMPIAGAGYGQLPIPKAWTRRIGPGSRGGTTFSQVPVSCDFAGNSKVFVSMTYWSSVSGNVLTLDVVDKTTGKLARVGDKIAGVNAARILSIPNSDNFIIAIVTTTAAAPIQFYTYDPFAGTLTNVASTANNLSANQLWDWCVVSAPLTPNKLFVLYKRAAGTDYTLANINMTSWAQTDVTFTLGVAATAAAVAVPRFATTKIKCLFSDAVNGTTSIWYTTGLVLDTAWFGVDPAALSAEIITACEDPSGNMYVASQVSQSPAASYNRMISRALVTSGASASACDAFYSGGLASKLVWCAEQSQAFCWAIYSTTEQPTYFLTSFDSSALNGNCIARARLYHTLGGPLRTAGICVPNLLAMGDGTYVTNALYIERLNTAGLSASQIYSTAAMWFSANARDGLLSLDVGGRTLIAGGTLATFDGANVVENGFLLFPEIVSTSNTAGSIASGTYSIVAVYESTDAKGMLHRSAVSPPVSYTIGGGPAGIIVTVQNYRPTSSQKNASVAIYRTLNGGKTYYRAVSNSAMSISSVSTALTLTLSDASIQANDILYTAGGVFDFWQPSAPTAIAADADRVVVVEGDNPDRAIISRETVRGEGLAFFEDYHRTVGVGGDDVNAVAAMLGRKFAFKQRGAYVASGNGADETLQNDDLSQFEPLSADVGAVSQASVVTTSYGIVFKSQKGFWMIGRDGSPVYVGAAVADYDSHTVTASCFNADTNEVTFILDDTTALVLSLYFNEQGLDWRWTIDTGMSVGDVAAVNGTKYLALTTPNTAAVYAESSATFVDNQNSPTTIVQKIATGWIVPSTIAGQCRVWGAYVLGDSKSTHTVQVEIAYDYEDFSETHTATSANATIGGSAYLFRVEPLRQRCTAIRFRISDVNPTGESYDLTGLVLELGVKQGGAKLRSEKQV